MWRSSTAALVGLLSLLATSGLAAQSGVSTSAEESPETHVVVGGDTLWSLAERFFGDADRWVVLYEANRASVAGPDRLYPGQVLVIPSAADAAVSGDTGATATEASATTDAGATAAGEARVAAIAVGRGGEAPRRDPGAPVPVRREDPVSPNSDEPVAPEGASAAAEAAGAATAEAAGAATTEAARAIPRAALAGAPFVVPGDEMAGVLDSIAPASLRSARTGDRLRLDLTNLDAEPGMWLQAFQRGRTLEGRGVVGVPTALLRVDAASPGTAMAVVEAVFGRVAPGHLLRPFGATGATVPGHTVAVSDGIQVEVLTSAVDKPILRPGDWVVLDAGADQGIEVGDEFVPAWVADAERRPGRLQVVDVSSSFATARIVRLGRSTFEPGRLLRLDRRRR